MAGMTGKSSSQGHAVTHTFVLVAVLVFFCILAIHLRFHGLGTRSLWLDEFSTWHVSRMPLSESLRWQPELTKPPLYQLCLRALTDDPHPSEWTLRLPAAVCGVLAVLAGAWLARLSGGWITCVALAGLAACSVLQINYSQEARGYSMMALGCTLSVVCWYKLVVDRRTRYLYGYVAATVLSFHAHYLTILTVLAEVLWYVWLRLRVRRGSSDHLVRPIVALGISGLICAPIVIHYVYCRSSAFQGLGWIPPATWRSSLAVLEELTFGRLWVFAVLLPGIILWLAAWFGWKPRPFSHRGGDLHSGPRDVCGLLLIWLGCVWFGLLILSWLVHPAMLARYALPAAVPALLIPLLVSHRLDRRAPLLLMVFFVVYSSPAWIEAATEYEPGFRELVQFLDDRVDPASEGVVLTIDNQTYPNWEDMERLAIQYYPLDGIEVQELHLGPDGVSPLNRILQEDPRLLYLVVMRADPLAILERAGRGALSITLDGQSYSQLPFAPYRLVLVAPARPN